MIPQYMNPLVSQIETPDTCDSHMIPIARNRRKSTGNAPKPLEMSLGLAPLEVDTSSALPGSVKVSLSCALNSSGEGTFVVSVLALP